MVDILDRQWCCIVCTLIDWQRPFRNRHWVNSVALAKKCGLRYVINFQRSVVFLWNDVSISEDMVIVWSRSDHSDHSDMADHSSASLLNDTNRHFFELKTNEFHIGMRLSVDQVVYARTQANRTEPTKPNRPTDRSTRTSNNCLSSMAQHQSIVSIHCSDGNDFCYFSLFAIAVAVAVVTNNKMVKLIITCYLKWQTAYTPLFYRI